MNQFYTGRFYLSAIVFDQWRFFTRISNCRGPFQIIAHKLKWLTLFDFWMFAASCWVFTQVLSRICLLRFFKHNELKMSKTHFFFQMAPRIYYCTSRELFWQAFEQDKVCIVESENLGCYRAFVLNVAFCNKTCLLWHLSETQWI
jgi:hypothetical protein